MLVIGRRVGESILIGQEIEILVVDASPSRVTLGICAPRQWTILRKEVQQAAESNRHASHSSSDQALKRLVRNLRRET
ncbi:MAG: carbon storage regulator [Bryobacteraceae bacterium]|nr:carbon storage regulator [Bryobacteraceae bacterium]MDW8379068.1 carbon storage regulator [Bryobacterales bacterium]